MTEIVLNTSTLPEPLMRFFRSPKVKARETRGEVWLTPVAAPYSNCPLLGMFKDGKVSVDKFIARKRLEKELE